MRQSTGEFYDTCIAGEFAPYDSPLFRSSGQSFFEDFEDNDLEDGTPVTWTGSRIDNGDIFADNGDMVFSLDPDSVVMTTETAVNTYSDGVIEMIYEMPSSSGIFVEAVIRETFDDIPNAYWGGVWPNGGLWMGYTSGGDPFFTTTRQSVGITPAPAAGEDVTIRLRALGNHIKLSAWPTIDGPGEAAVLEWTDPQNLWPTGDLVFPAMAPNGANDQVRIRSFQFTELFGDVNGDGQYSCGDVDALVGEIVAGTNNTDFDMNGDDAVDANDLDAWLTEAGANELASGNPYQEGDANLDGVVDVADFNLWNANKFTENAAWCGGDFNADGNVDVGDFNLWNANKFSAADAAVVPESDGLDIAIFLFGIGFVGRGRRSLRRSFRRS